MSNVTPDKLPQNDLPNIGKPALRALASIGCSHLEQVTRFSEKELLALHGLGPRAIRLLRAALAERGAAFRSDQP